MGIVVRYIFIYLILSSIVTKSYSQELFFEKVTGDNFNIDAPIQGISKDSTGYLWIASWNGLYKYDGINYTVFKHNPNLYNNIPDNRIRSIVTDSNQQIWILTYENKHIKYDYSTSKFSIVRDSSLLKEVKDLLLYDSNTINKDKEFNGKRYFLYKNHFASYDKITNDTTIFYPNVNKYGGLPDEIINCFYIDNQDIIWIGTEKGNLYKADLNRLPFSLNQVYAAKDNRFLQCQISSILKLDNEIWFGTFNNGIQIKSVNGEYLWQHPYYKTNSSLKNILSLSKDKNGNIWIGTKDKGLWVYKTKSKKLSKVLDDKSPDAYLNIPYIYCMEPSKDDHLMVGSYKSILKVNQDNYQFKRSDLHRMLNSILIRDIIEDEDKNIWIATEGYCVYRLRFNENMQCIDTMHIKDFTHVTDGQYEGECAYTLHEDKEGFVWAGTSEGLYKINKKNNVIQKYSKQEGLIDEYICAIEEDRDGNIWFSTKKGISKIHKHDMSVSNFLISEASENWVFMSRSSFNDTINNIIYFGAREGYVSFNPRSIKSNKYAPKLILENLYISGKHIYPNEKINDEVVINNVLAQTKNVELKYNSNSFGIELTSLNFQNPRWGKFFYKLEGYNDNWVASNSNEATFIKVPHGEYKFVARTISHDNIYSNIASLNITILPPWYLTYWAYGLYFVIIVVVFLAVYKVMSYQQELRNRILIEKINAEKQEEINKDKIEFFTNVSHELRTPLTLIQDPLKQLDNKSMTSEHRKLYLSIINKNVDRLSNLINQILDFRKSEENKLLAEYSVEDGIRLIEDCVKTFEVMADQRKITLLFESDLPQLVGYFDKKKLEQIILNLVSNAFKYTPDGGKVVVRIKSGSRNDELYVTISDTGVGIKPEALNKIFDPFNTAGSAPFYGSSSGMGLALTKKMIELLGGSISIESKSNEGTIVKFSIHFDEVNDEQKVIIEKQYDQNPIIDALANEIKDDSSISTILVVEDNEDIQTYLKIELAEKYNVVGKLNGVDGLEYAIENIPDIIISDVMMPEMDGITLCDRIKTNEKTSHIPVIMLTAKSTEKDHIAGLKTGADYYFSKPFSVEVLKAQIKSIIENRLKLQEKLAAKRSASDLEIGENEIDNRFLKKTIGLINDNIEVVGFNTENLADLLEISPRQLYRKLKAITGSTAKEFILKVKMEKASELLLKSDYNISEIAYQLGFSEHSNFTRSFTKHYGCSPTQFSNTHK